MKILSNKEYNLMINYQVEQLRKICDLQKEIERLNNELENVKMHYETEAEAKYYEFIDNHESKLQQRIDKAIEYINKFDDISAYYEYIDEDGYNEYFDVDFKKDMLGILKGVDKE